jgi:hypothetical protein
MGNVPVSGRSYTDGQSHNGVTIKEEIASVAVSNETVVAICLEEKFGFF